MPYALALFAQAAPAAAVQTQNQVAVFEPAYFADQRPENAFDMIRRLPGFNLDAGVQARGFAGSGGNVRIDGQLPASRDNIETILRRIPASAVARIELVTGGAPGVDMQGRAVVANVVRRTEAGLKGSAVIGAALHEDGRGRASGSVQAERRSGQQLLEGSAYYLQDIGGSEGLRVRGLLAPITSNFDNKIRIYVSGATGAVERPVLGGRIRINAAYSNNEAFRITGDTPGAGALPSLEFGSSEAEAVEGGATFTRPIGQGGQLQLTGFQRHSRSRDAIDFTQGAGSSTFDLSTEQGESILRGLVRMPARGAWRWEGGAEAASTWLESESHLVRNGTVIPLPPRVRVEELRGEVYGNATWTQWPRLSIQAEARFEASNIASAGATSQEKTLTYFKPRLTFTWTPAPGHLVSLRAERAVDQLSFNDFSSTASLTDGTVVVGNPGLEPAISTFVEARYERRFTPKANLVLVYNYRDYENFVGRNIFVTPGGTFEAPANVGRAERQTFSVVLNLPLDRAGLKGGLFRGAVQWRDTELTDPLTGQRRPFSNEEPYSWRINLSQDIPGSKFRWGAELLKIGAFPVFQVSELGSVARDVSLSANLDYRIAPDLTLRLEGFNLLNRQSDTRREVYSAPRGTGVVNFRERRLLTDEAGGRALRLSLTKTF